MLLYISTATFIKSYETVELNLLRELQGSSGVLMMRAAPILLIFFLMFTVGTLLVPFPMFPGNFLCDAIGPVIAEYSLYLSAFFNGLFYGVVLWLVFAGFSKKLEQES